MIGYLIGYTIVVVGAAVSVYVLTHRWEKRFRAALVAAVPVIDEIPGDPSDPLPELDGPITIDATILRVMIQEAVREAVTPKQPV